MWTGRLKREKREEEMDMWRILLWIALAGAVFAGGFVAGTITSDDASYSVSIQEVSEEQPPDGVNFNDVDDPAKMDSFLGLYLGKQSTDKVEVDLENPDYMIKLHSPKRSIGLLDARLWFTDEGAVIGERRGETWNQTTFYTITESDASYIQSIIEER